MIRVLWTSRPGLVSLFANVRLLVAAREVGSMEENPARVREKPETMGVREIQPTRGTSIIAAGLGHHAESLDVVAGSEFVDDRIRLRE